MSWPFRRRDPGSTARLPHARPMTVDREDDGLGAATAVAFACTTCGRTDLAPAGDWDPPVCEECDAAINFDALTEEMDDHADD